MVDPDGLKTTNDEIILPPSIEDECWEIAKESNRDFFCRCCGKCCSLEEITVLLDDRKKIATTLKISLEDAERAYFEKIDGLWQIKHVDGHCIFLNAEMKCTIHYVRPDVCKSYPFNSPDFIRSCAFRMCGYDVNFMFNTCPAYEIAEKIRKKERFVER